MARIGGQKVPFMTVLLMVTESSLLFLGLWMATALQSPLNASLSSSPAIVRCILVVVICEVCLYYYDLYDLQVVNRRSVLVIRLMQAFGIACIGLALIYTAAPDLSLGPGVAIIAAPSILMVIIVWRIALEAASPIWRRPERVLFVGTGPSGIAAAREITNRPEAGMSVVGFLEEQTAPGLTLPGSAPVLGQADLLEEVAQQERIARVVISLTERRGRMPVRELLHLKFQGVQIEDAHTLFERVTGRIMLEHLNPSWLIMSDGFRKSAFLRAAKRSLDVLVAGLALIVASPIMLLVALAIRMESPGPALFRQKRTGLKGREFEILKFRSMRQKPADAPPSWTAQGDNRITRVGKFIRKSRLDELPQFINVLRGEMSLVGPRPEQPYFCSVLEQHIPYYHYRHSARPGITGWAQIKYGYGGSIEETKIKLEHDLFYIKHMSFTLDLLILLETAKVMVSGRGAN